MRSFSPRKLVCTIIPIFGTVSVIGTGFCMWSFDEKSGEGPKTSYIDVNVMSEAKMGAFDNRSLISDKAGIDAALEGYVFPKMLIFDEGRKSGNLLTQGITFYKIISNTEIDPHYNNEYPAFETEPFVSDSVLITFYRDSTISIEDLNKNGERFCLEVEISITPKLGQFISILDTYNFSYLSTKADMSQVYKYEFTDYAKMFGVKSGKQIKDEIKKTITSPADTTPNNLKDDLLYEQYSYVMNFSQIFRWKDINLKPTDKASYDKIKELCIKPKPGETFKPESISFDFTASLKGKIK